MLKIKTIDYEINNKSDFTLQEMIKVTEDLENGKYPNAKNDFNYVLYDDGDNQEILEAHYKINTNNVNIYRHAKTVLSEIETQDKDMKRIKQTILKQLDDEAKYYKKSAEENFKTQKQNQKKKIQYTPNTSYMNAKQNKGINKETVTNFMKSPKGKGFLALVLVAILVMVYLYSTMPTSSKSEDKITKEDIYQQALLGQEEKAISNFEKIPKEDLNKKDKKIYINLLIDNEHFSKAKKINGSKYVENQLFEKDKYKQLEKFNEQYPTNNGDFDVYIQNKNYQDALKLVDDIDKTEKRKINLAKAYIETDDLNSAKKLSSTIESDKVTQLIQNKESEIASSKEKQLDKKEKEYDKIKDKDKKDKEADELKEDIEKLESEIKELRNENE
ncbi:hypothetical protein P1A20_12810 [Staphylococcus equorum]|uniref:hypothetical protein n=1 Tax=Staphylococcus equorum TaxID=246432 RepID=UPI0025526B8A|nr:hypothetical protein [Staphylococcus equorum]MDK9847466.1 hypothetical protein [Staphylococcus equorum]